MKFGSLEIKKAYYGRKLLTYNNAYIGKYHILKQDTGDYVLVENSYSVWIDGQYYLTLVKYGEIIPGVKYFDDYYENPYPFIPDTESVNKLPGYTYLMSSNKGMDGTTSAIFLDWNGLDEVTLYYRTNGEKNYDYLLINYNGNTVLSTKTDNPSEEFKTITIQRDEDSNEPIIVEYYKDGSVSENADRGYIGFIEEYREILDTKRGDLLPSEYVWKGQYIIEDEKYYEKLVREYTLPNGDKVVNYEDFKQGEEIEVLPIPYLSNNTQNIDTYWKTDYIPTVGTRAIIEFKGDNTAEFPGTSFFMLFGARYRWREPGAFSAYYDNPHGNWYIGDTFNGSAYDYVFYDNQLIGDDKIHTVELSSIGQNGETDRGYLRYDDQIEEHYSTYNNPHNYAMWFGACNEQNHTTDRTSRCNIYSFKIYEYDTLVRNYVPMPDGRFYDTITSTYAETIGQPIYGEEIPE